MEKTTIKGGNKDPFKDVREKKQSPVKDSQRADTFKDVRERKQSPVKKDSRPAEKNKDVREQKQSPVKKDSRPAEKNKDVREQKQSPVKDSRPSEKYKDVRERKQSPVRDSQPAERREKKKEQYDKTPLRGEKEFSLQEPSVPVVSPTGDADGEEPIPVSGGDRFQRGFFDLGNCHPRRACRSLGRAIGVRDELNLALWKEALSSRAKSSDVGICIRNSCSCVLGVVDYANYRNSENVPDTSKKDYHKSIKRKDLANSGDYAYGADGMQFYLYLTKLESKTPKDAIGKPVPSYRPKQILEIAKEMFRIDPTLSEEEKELVNYRITKKLQPRRFGFPYFLTVLSVIQVISMIVLLSVYGVEEPGLDPQVTIVQDVVTLRGIEQVDMWTRPNVWIGPPVAGLIKAGAVYGPCMRTDATIAVILLSTAYKMGEPLGCCSVVNHSVAATLTRVECSNGTFGGGKWEEHVCDNTVDVKHMLRPCCFGLLGSCKMTTETGCKVQHGTFHKDKNHCSEVFCFPSFCGKKGLSASRQLKFMPSTANQGWRFLVAFIYTAGILHLILLVFFQWTVGRPIEAMAGSLRMALVYLYASFGGNLVGAFMDPYLPQVGAGGGLTCLVLISVTEICQCRKEMKGHFAKELVLILILLLFIFIVGFVPLVNNFCHLGGILFGLPLAFLLMPHLNFNYWNCRARRIIVGVSLVLIIITLMMFLMLFYLIQDTGLCKGCYYFSCIPFTEHMCNILVELIGTIAVD